MHRSKKLTKQTVRAFSLGAAAGTLALVAVGGASGAADASPAVTKKLASQAGARTLTFEITIRNLGRADLTSVVYAVHNRSARLFRFGRKASPGLARLAEDGVTSGLIAEARRKRGVREAGEGPRIGPRSSARFRVTTTRKHLRLSWGTMQVCTNDTIAGQSAVKLPARKVGARKVFRIRAIDVGSEQNTESRAHVPCLGAHDVGPDENKVVRRSPGVQGIADVNNATQGWGRFLARVTIKRVA